ncbi:glycoside hydrolase family 3 protein [Schaalia sp. JY-X169]|uniref:glycoside hydrolase family 3 protein n=1 Tax=Schaalia sp. JY-X169 TaxID=2758572 RepID=UPI0015F4F292|nr:glycoside hydrolase family 3 N-terminal domain-containing protein [Schaalia sp. JY-X169]
MGKKTVEQALAEVSGWSDEVLVGQLFSVASGGHAAKDILGFGGGTEKELQEEVHERLKEYIRQYHLGAVIYFPPGGDHEPVADIRATNLDLQAAADIPLLIATDQENGTVARVRVGAAHMPGAMALGATEDPRLWAEVGHVTGEQLRAVGIFQTFAPVADVNVLSENPGVNIRSAGSDPEKASSQLATVTRALAEGGVASTLKHFPGYGSAAADPHLGLPSVSLTREEWENTERLPFQAAIDAGADSIMLGHVAFPDLDPKDAATFSAPIVTDLLRHDLGFEGVIITDAMDMGGAERPEGPAEACVVALQAGADQILMPVDLPEAYEAVLRALREGRLNRAELEKSATRILRLKKKLGLDSPQIPDLEIFDNPHHTELARAAAAASVAERDASVEASLMPGSNVLVIHPGKDPQKRGANPGDVLTPILEGADHSVTLVEWGATEDEGGPWRGLDSAATEDATEAVVVLRDAWKDSLPVAEVLAELDQAGLNVHVVALRSPHESASVSQKHSVLFTYGDNLFAIEAAGNVLVGKEKPDGGLPMPVTTLEAAQEAGK